MEFSEEHAWTPKQRFLIIAAVVVAVLVVVSVLLYGYQRYQRGKAMKGVENVEDLGSGFRRVTIAKTTKTGLGHYPFLFYRGQVLCQIGPFAPSLSPSGNFAVCQDVRSGKLVLFRRRDEKTTELTKSFIGMAKSFVWHEEQGTVEATIAGEGMSVVFPLQ